MERKSFIVTGASATGKTHLYYAAMESGYTPLPTHVTRKIRDGEVNGKDAWFISKQEFIDRFSKGEYLEPSLEWALFKVNSEYYGTPRSWINCLPHDGFCAMPSNILAARRLFHEISLYSSNFPVWVHLVCPEEIRKLRMERRGLSAIEIAKRLISGDSIKVPPESDLVFDTSRPDCTTNFMLLILNKAIAKIE